MTTEAEARASASLDVCFAQTESVTEQHLDSPPLSPRSKYDNATKGWGAVCPTQKLDEDDLTVLMVASTQSLPRRPNSMRRSILSTLRPLSLPQDGQQVVGARPPIQRQESRNTDAGQGSDVLFTPSVAHSGEGQIPGSIRRKRRNQFFVLTKQYLIAFRNQAKAAEVFPLEIPYPSPSPTKGTRPGSIAFEHRMSTISSASIASTRPALGSIDGARYIPIESIVAVHKSECTFAPTLEVCYMMEATKGECLQISFASVGACDKWLRSLHSATSQLKISRSVEPSTMQHLEHIVAEKLDYDPIMFDVFTVVRRSQDKTKGKSQLADKLVSTICYLVIGIHKLHIIPLDDAQGESKILSSLGLMILTSMLGNQEDDNFTLAARLPLQASFDWQLSSTQRMGVINTIRRRFEYLRPLWKRQPLVTNMEVDSGEEAPHMLCIIRDDEAFVRTLVAYCSAYDVDTSNICYTLEFDCEDAPRFQLHAPATTSAYTAHELLAVLRALRHNELFETISFANVNLDALRDAYDDPYSDSDFCTARDGTPVQLDEEHKLSALAVEVRTLALQSSRLTRLNFSYCLTKDPCAPHPAGCGIPEALLPLCRRRLTNVDWLALNGIKLGETDLDYLSFAASSEESCIRGLEIAHCGLSLRDIDIVLSTLVAQSDSLEVLDISGAQGVVNGRDLHQYLAHLPHMRSLSLSHLQCLADTQPLLDKGDMLNWRLESLTLNHTNLNQATIGLLREYLASPSSHTLRELRLDGCGLDGADIGSFMPYMMGHSGKPRNLHLYVSEATFKNSISLLSDAIRSHKTPTHMTLRSVRFMTENPLLEIFEALRGNRSLVSLDISQASLLHGASLEIGKALGRVFAENTALQELNISGRNDKSESAKMRVAIAGAFHGLIANKNLKVLRVERQSLGKQGAHALATVLRENRSLREIHCGSNDFDVKALRILVNALSRNKTMLYLSEMNEDRLRCIERLRRETTRGLGAGSPTSERNGTARPPTPLSSARRSIRVAASTANKLATSSLRFGSNSEPSSPTSPTSPGMPPAPLPVPAQESTKVSEAVDRMVQTWDNEVLRMRRYLQRNYDLSQGSKVEAETQSSPPHVTWTAGQGSLERKSFIFMKPFDIESEELEEETRQSTPISLIQFLREKQPSTQQALDGPDARRTHKLVSCAKQTRKLSPTTLGELWKQGHLGRKRSRNPSQRSQSTTALGIPGKGMEDSSSGGPTRRLSEKFSKLSRSLSLRRPKEMQPPRSTGPQEQSEEPEVVESDNVAHRRSSRKRISCAKVSENDGEHDASGIQASDTTALTDDEDEDGDETLEPFDDECGGDTIYEALAYPADAVRPSKRRDSAVDFFTFLRGEEKHSLQGLHWRPPVTTNRTYEHQQRQRAVWRPPATFVV